MREEERNINIQLYALFFSVLSIIISIILTYNEKLNIKNKKQIFSKKTNYNVSLFNRILILTIAFVFLYINYKSYQSAKKQKENISNYEWQIWAAILAIGSALISLYVVSRSSAETIADIENPLA